MRKGFTLIELMIVISVIIILAGMLVPALHAVSEASKKRAQDEDNRAALNDAAIQEHMRKVAEIRAHQPPPPPPPKPVEALTAYEDHIVHPDENPNFKTVYNSHNTNLNIDYTMVVDQETGVEYIIVRTAGGGVTITPRFHQDKIDTNVEKK